MFPLEGALNERLGAPEDLPPVDGALNLSRPGLGVVIDLPGPADGLEESISLRLSILPGSLNVLPSLPRKSVRSRSLPLLCSGRISLAEPSRPPGGERFRSPLLKSSLPGLPPDLGEFLSISSLLDPRAPGLEKRPRSRLRSKIDSAPFLTSGEPNPLLWSLSLPSLRKSPLLLFAGSMVTTLFVIGWVK